LEQLQEKIDHLEKFHKKGFIAKYIFPLFPFIIAIWGLFISWNTFRLTEKNFLSNIKPLIYVYTKLLPKNECDLRINNQGSIPIIDIHVKRYFFSYYAFDPNYMMLGISGNDWKSSSFLDVNKVLSFHIDTKEFTEEINNANTMASSKKVDKSEINSFVVYHIIYKREVDKQVYNSLLYMRIFESNEKPNTIVATEENFMFDRKFKATMDSLFLYR
jgi:hypothetical protein